MGGVGVRSPKTSRRRSVTVSRAEATFPGNWSREGELIDVKRDCVFKDLRSIRVKGGFFMWMRIRCGVNMVVLDMSIQDKTYRVPSLPLIPSPFSPRRWDVPDSVLKFDFSARRLTNGSDPIH